MAALTDWLVTRTLTRSAIFMPKPPPVLVAYQTLNLAGQLATTLTSLLALAALGWIAWSEWRAGHTWLPPTLLGLAALSLAALIVPMAGWPALASHGLSLAALGIILYRKRGSPAILLPAAALLAGRLDQASAAWYTAMRWPGPSPLAGALFNLGELCIVLSTLGLWWAYGRSASWRIWLAAAPPALAFVALYLANPAMAGILAIWSTGLSLYLPWPAYAASLWLAGVTVLALLQWGDPAGWAVLLLTAGGYAPQQSHQVFVGLIALWLLARPPLAPPQDKSHRHSHSPAL